MTTPMKNLYDKLAKILQLEVQRGYTNSAVIGGIDSFLTFWFQEAHAMARGEDMLRVDEIVTALRSYSALSPEDRARVVADVLTRLGYPAPPMPSTRKEAAPQPRTEETHTKPTPAEPSPPPSAPSPERKAPKPAASAAPKAKPAPAPATTAVDADALLAADARFDEPVTAAPRVGAKWAKHLQRLGIHTVRDLLYHLPHRYDDFSRLKTISELMYGDVATITGTVEQTQTRQGKRRGTLIITSLISDGTGVIQATWFNQPHLARQLRAGRAVRLSGHVGQYMGRLVMESPEWEPLDSEQLHTGGIVPVYPLTQGVPIKWLRATIRQTLDAFLPHLPDPVPAWVRQQFNLPTLHKALRQVHAPKTQSDIEEGRRRLAFDELLIIQLGVLQQRAAWKSVQGVPIPTDEAALARFQASLPFEMTGAQQRALREILDDIAQPSAMSRLLQGDVGAGKTVVAAAALLNAVANGFQGALMAPTEILAEQHARSLEKLLNPETPLLADGRPIRVALLTGSLSAGERAAVLEDLASGAVDVVVGTHALIQDDVHFHRLGLAIVDEQHRFGVRQRATLREKGYNPHMLVMSATPIPRSLALTIYGDLDLSIIDELPKGRQPIKTYVIRASERERAYTFIRKQVNEGRQAFIICPLVEESEKIEARAAVEEHARLSREVFPEFRLGLLHGRMSAEEKEAVMRAFYAGEIHILVSTAVVEVGIDVPNATVMLIESANRFGLAQLHQFRGRVGRGQYQSYCILVAEENLSAEGEARLRIMAETNDGFRLAEEDLKMRGPGEFFGTRQSGLPDLRVARLGDSRTLDLARRAAQAILERDPTLDAPQHALLRKHMERFWANAQGDLS